MFTLKHTVWGLHIDLTRLAFKPLARFELAGWPVSLRRKKWQQWSLPGITSLSACSRTKKDSTQQSCKRKQAKFTLNPKPPAPNTPNPGFKLLSPNLQELEFLKSLIQSPNPRHSRTESRVGDFAGCVRWLLGDIFAWARVCAECWVWWLGVLKIGAPNLGSTGLIGFPTEGGVAGWAALV